MVMTQKEKLLRNIRDINNKAKSNGDTQQLLKSLVRDVKELSTDYYSSTLEIATFDTGVSLGKGYSLLSEPQKYWTQLWDLKDNYLLNSKEIKQAHQQVGNIRFVIDNISKTNLVGIKHNFKAPNKNDVLNLVKRFLTIKDFQEKTYHMGAINNPDDIGKLILHDVNVARHGFIHEALDDLLSLNVPEDVKNIINNNLEYKNKSNRTHNRIINKKNKYKLLQFYYQKHSQAIRDINIKDIESICEDILFRLKRYIAGKPSTRKYIHKRDTPQRHKMEQFLIKQKKVYHAHYLSPILKFIKENYKVLTHKYQYFDIDSRAEELLFNTEINKTKPNQQSIKSASKYWTITSMPSKERCTYLNSPSLSLEILQSFSKTIKTNKKLKKIVNKYIKYVKEGHCLMMSDIEIHPIDKTKDFKEQVHKVYPKDIRFIINDLLYSMNMKRMTLNYYNKWIHLIIKDERQATKFKNLLLRNINNSSTSELSPINTTLEDINSVNMNCKEYDAQTYDIKNIQTGLGFIELLNDLKDFEKE